MYFHVLYAYGGYAVNHKSGVCKSTWLQHEVGNSNLLIMVLIWLNVIILYSNLSFTFVIPNNHHCRYKSSVVFGIMLITKRHYLLNVWLSVDLPHFSSSNSCIFTTIKCQNCPYNLFIRAIHILLNMIKKSKIVNLILR